MRLVVCRTLNPGTGRQLKAAGGRLLLALAPVFAVEAVDASFAVDEFLLAGVERMAVGADVHFQRGFG